MEGETETSDFPDGDDWLSSALGNVSEQLAARNFARVSIARLEEPVVFYGAFFCGARRGPDALETKIIAAIELFPSKIYGT